MTSNDFRLVYDILADIYIKGAYSTIKLNDTLRETKHKDRIVRIVYGVLDRDVELEYYISKLCKAKPKNHAKIILKIALYSIIYMDSMPNYAVVDNAVELCKAVGKREYQGFVNAVLKEYIRLGSVPLPKNEKERLSVELSKPLWLVNALINQYGRDTAVDIMSFESGSDEHIRPNTRRITYKRMLEILRESYLSYMGPIGLEPMTLCL